MKRSREGGVRESRMNESRDLVGHVIADPRGWKVIHQSIGICQLNLRNRSLLGWVDLRIKTTKNNIKDYSILNSL